MREMGRKRPQLAATWSPASHPYSWRCLQSGGSSAEHQLLLRSLTHLCACPLQALAVDISLAALLGKNIYNFGELLLHPIVSVPLTYVAFLHSNCWGTAE